MELPEFEVTVRMEDKERVYPNIEARSRYAAVTQVLAKFIKEFNLPGRPYEYWSGERQKGVIEFSAKCSIDGRAMRDLHVKEEITC